MSSQIYTLLEQVGLLPGAGVCLQGGLATRDASLEPCCRRTLSTLMTSQPPT